GRAWQGASSFRGARRAHPDNPKLFYWGALAHARAGAAQTARALLARAEAGAASGSVRLGHTLSLRGRLWKDVVHREAGGSAATEAAQRAREQYLQAHAIARDPYPGINAA